ncbi:hypothetical protein [Pseudomonas sp. Marseille-Q5115]|uniref:hypothetical protein n=1 Tax=Pseudomonas sp. Marseille-Q5115 TaxID=2866593 RepID=UPI001CE3C5B3|nr:hypothetical protein [Pseudomonas sp. Marseille-Q5115]
MTNQTMQQAAAHHFGIAWDELSQFEQAHWEAAYRAGSAALSAENERLREDRDSQQRVCIRVMEERDQLKAENERLQASIQGYQMGAKAEAEEADRLRGEVKELREHKQYLQQLREADGFESWSAVLVEVAKLRIENEARRRDAERLDRLDAACEPYGFEEVHEGNRWLLDGPFRTVRDAIDSLPDAEPAMAKEARP